MGSQEVKGDWRPVVVLLLMSEPTDDFGKGLVMLDAVKTGGRFALISKAVSKAAVNRLHDSGFSVVTEESSREEGSRWLHDAIQQSMDFAEQSVRPPELDA